MKIINIKDAPKKEKCIECGQVHKYEEMFLCDGFLFKQRTLPFGEWKNVTCDKLLCKSCKKQVAGYDLCSSCYKRRNDENKNGDS